MDQRSARRRFHSKAWIKNGECEATRPLSDSRKSQVEATEKIAGEGTARSGEMKPKIVSD